MFPDGFGSQKVGLSVPSKSWAVLGCRIFCSLYYVYYALYHISTFLTDMTWAIWPDKFWNLKDILGHQL